MSAIESRCPECGYGEVLEFGFHGLFPPLAEDACPRCLQPMVAVAHVDAAELGDDARPVARPGGGTYPVSEEAEAIQRALLRQTLGHLDAELAPAWDRRVGIRTAGAGWLFGRAYVDAPADVRGVELFTALAAPSVPRPALRVACHALSRKLEGEVVLADNDIDLARPALDDRPSTPFYRWFVDRSDVDSGALLDRLGRARAEADLAAAAVVQVGAGESPCYDAGTGRVDEAAFDGEVISPQPLDAERADVGAVTRRVGRYLARIGLYGEEEQLALPLSFVHGSSSVQLGILERADAVLVHLRAVLAVGVDVRRALPFLVDFNRAEEMGRFRVTRGGEVTFEHVLLAEDLDVGELLRGLTLVAEVADDRDDVVAELGGGKVPDPPDDGRNLAPAFSLLEEGGLLEDVAVTGAEAIGRVDHYLHGFGIAPTVDHEGVRWVHSGSTQVAIRARERADGAVVVLEAPVVYEAEESDDLPSVLNELNSEQHSGAFTYDTAGRCVWFRDALFANDLDRSELARGLLDVAETADAHDEPLSERLGGRRTLDVVEERTAAWAEEALERTLSGLQASDPGERLAAARALSRQEGVRVADALTAALADASEEVSAAALRSLLTSPAVSVAEQVLTNLCAVAASEGYPPHARGHALWGLEVLGDERALTAVRTALSSEEPVLRARAARAGGRLAKRGFARPEVARELLDLVWDVDPWVQREASTAVAAVAAAGMLDIDAEAVVGRLVPLLDGAPSEVHPSVFEALALLGAPAAVAVAAFAEAPATATRAGVARVLRAAAPAEQLPALRRLAKDPSAEVREDAVAGLAHVDGPAAREELRNLFAGDPDIDVRRMALEALVALPGAAEDEVLRRALEQAHGSDDGALREDAAWGLAALSGTDEALAGGERGRTLRRMLGRELPRLLEDLADSERAGLADDEAAAGAVIGRRLKAVGAAAAAAPYPAYAFGLIRLLGLWAPDDPDGVLAEVAAGSTALAAVAARQRSESLR